MGTAEKKKVMGVLDIYGFEILEVKGASSKLSTLLPFCEGWMGSKGDMREGRQGQEGGSALGCAGGSLQPVHLPSG